MKEGKCFYDIQKQKIESYNNDFFRLHSMSCIITEY